MSFTNKALELAKNRAKELDINTVIVASTSGDTGVMAAQFLTDFNLVVVTHSHGFAAANENELTTSNRATIEKAGAKILTCPHAFSGVSRAIRKKWSTYGTDDVVASTLRILGQGFKVAVEISLMATDAGLVATGKPCISIGGSGHGADTAIVLNPVNLADFFDLQVTEIIT